MACRTFEAQTLVAHNYASRLLVLCFVATHKVALTFVVLASACMDGEAARMKQPCAHGEQPCELLRSEAARGSTLPIARWRTLFFVYS